MTLAACGDSSSSPGSAGTHGGSGTPPPAPTAITATGGAAKGILKNALVKVSEWDATSKQFIALIDLTTRTDEKGQFTLDLPDNNQPLLVTVSTDASTDMICDVAACTNINGENLFGQFINLGEVADLIGEGFTLKAILPSGASTTSFAVTPLTTLAAQWVEKLSGDANINLTTVNQALSQVAELFGLSADFYAQLPSDITDSATTGTADMTAGILAAAFYVPGESIDDSINSMVAEYLANGGQLPISSDPALQNTINALINRANDIAAVAFNATYGDGSQLDAIVDSLNNLVNRWGMHAKVTSATSSADFSADEQQQFAQAKSLFTQLETYLHLAGIDDSGDFLTNSIAQQMQWMYHDQTARDDTAGLIGTVASIALRTAGFSMLAATPEAAILLNELGAGSCAVALDAGSQVPSGIDDICKESDGTLYLVFTSPVTTPNGSIQQVNAKITVPTLSLGDLIGDSLTLDFSLAGTNSPVGTMSNSTVAGELAGNLVVTLSPDGADLSGVVQSLASSDGLSALFSVLLNSTLTIDVSDVQGKLTRNSPAGEDELVQQGQSFDIALDGLLDLDLTALHIDQQDHNGTTVPVLSFDDDKTLLKGIITAGEFIAPREINGQRHDYIKALDSTFCNYEGSQRKALNVVIADTSTAEGCFAARLAGIPELNIAFQGQLGGAIGIVNQVIGGFFGAGALTGIIDGIDMSNLDLTGTAKLLVKDDQTEHQTYLFTLDRNHITATWQKNGNTIDIYFSGVQGGYLVSGGVWVGTFHIDWINLALNVQLADNTNQTFALGSIFDILDPELLSLVISSLSQISLQ